jgi:hypothetical protein
MALSFAVAGTARGAGESGPVLGASSSAPDHPPDLAMDGRLSTSWQSGASGTQDLTVDFGAPRELGGIAVTWEPDLAASLFTVDVSDDGWEWRTLRRVYGAAGEKGWVRLRAAKSRFLRVRCVEGDGPAFAIRDVEILPAAVAASPEALVHLMTAAARRGLFPRAFGGEPTSFSAAGPGSGRGAALLSRDGALEPGDGGFSIEPFVRVAGRLLTWADVRTETSLEKGLPDVPVVTWTSREVALDVTALPDGSGAASRLLARYRLTNLTAGRLVATLVLAVRPFLIRAADGSDAMPAVAAIRRLDWDGRHLLVNGRRPVVPLRTPASFNATSFAGGDVTAYLEAGRVPPAHEVEDPAGLGTGVLTYPVALEAGGSAVVVLELPAAAGAGKADPAAPDGGASLFEEVLERALVAPGRRPPG